MTTLPKFLASRSDAEERLARCAAKYTRLRRLTRDQLDEEALRAYRQRVNVCQIDKAAFSAIRDDWDVRGRKVAFPWESDILRTLHKSHPRRLDLAMWSDGRLCGLAVARVSDAKKWVSLTYIEGSPDQTHPLKGKIVPLALVGADIYASLIQHEDGSEHKPKVRLLNPLNESMVCYERMGYSHLIQANGYRFATNYPGSTP